MREPAAWFSRFGKLGRGGSTSGGKWPNSSGHEKHEKAQKSHISVIPGDDAAVEKELRWVFDDI
jgi:hypothetical protein